MQIKIDEIRRLKKSMDCAILAHYYVSDEIQEIADYVGDSYYLSKIVGELPQKTIMFCGVSFMGESAKILNPDKTILMPDLEADCPMAHMASPEEIQRVRLKYEKEGVAVVCYINSSAELKRCSDVCVTSANALNIVRKLPQKNIYFIPDENLGRYIATRIPDKHFIFNQGYCHAHKSITSENVKSTQKKHSGALVLAHPECTPDVLQLADYIGSTTGIIQYVANNKEREYIVCTEEGVLYELKKQNPEKIFYLVSGSGHCHNMKRNTIDKVLYTLLERTNQVKVDDELCRGALLSLERMLVLGG